MNNSTATFPPSEELPHSEYECAQAARYMGSSSLYKYIKNTFSVLLISVNIEHSHLVNKQDNPPKELAASTLNQMVCHQVGFSRSNRQFKAEFITGHLAAVEPAETTISSIISSYKVVMCK